MFGPRISGAGVKTRKEVLVPMDTGVGRLLMYCGARLGVDCSRWQSWEDVIVMKAVQQRGYAPPHSQTAGVRFKEGRVRGLET